MWRKGNYIEEFMVWVLMVLGGAICTSLTTILAKISIKDVNSNFATSLVRIENFAIAPDTIA